MTYYLAIDLGATNGKHILARIEGGKIVYEEVHRFENQFKNMAQTGSDALCWDSEKLFGEIITGLKKCTQIDKKPSYVGIDTWGVDYALIGDLGGLIGETVSYRDKRTDGIPEEVSKIISEEELYRLTGVQKQQYNTIYQLYSQVLNDPDELQGAAALLMTPCYYNYLLTGVIANEYTIASTTGLMNAESGTWDLSIIDRLGLPRHIFGDIKPAGSILGEFMADIVTEVGYSAKVVLPAAHDTASAVLAVPSLEETVFLSSGTWSLMGVETPASIHSEEARTKGFTNEGCFGGTNRILKNIMGLWMVRSIRNNLGNKHTYDEMCELAKKHDKFPSIINVSDQRFLAPKSMIDEVMQACEDNSVPIPESVGEVCAVVYKSLAKYYGQTILELEELTGKKYSAVNLVGGGTRDTYLNSLTAKYCGKKAFVGPTEATCLGNIAAQMLATGEIANKAEAKQMIINSVKLDEYVNE